MEYEYRAVTKDGQKKSGVKDAASQTDLARGLREEGYFLISASEKSQSASPMQKEGAKSSSWIKKDFSVENIFKSVSLQEKMLFSRHLALMVKAGFSLNKALDTLVKQTKNKYFSKIIADISAKISSGKNFNQALSDHQNVFPPIFLNMVKVGEASGKLQESLKLVTLHLKRENSLKRKIRGAMVYPIVIILAMAGVGAVMMTFVLPQLALTFSELNVPLPISTQIIFGVSNFMAKFWYLMIIILAALAYLFYFIFRKTEFGRRAVNFFFLKMPIFSELTKKINSARFSRTLNSLITGGVSLTEAIEITSGTLTNYFYRKAVGDTKAEIEKGKKLSTLLAEHPELFPPMVTEMVSVGEETGSLTTMLKELAIFFEREVAVATKSMSSIVEPVLMIIIGIVVGIFALSIIQPIYSIGTGL